MRVLLDSDVVFDFVFERIPFFQAARELIDYEDAVQHASAFESGLDAIITRNVKDYKNARLPIFTPDDFLQHLKSQPKAQP